jgi:hypothetical protein
VRGFHKNTSFFSLIENSILNIFKDYQVENKGLRHVYTKEFVRDSKFAYNPRAFGRDISNYQFNDKKAVIIKISVVFESLFRKWVEDIILEKRE